MSQNNKSVPPEDASPLPPQGPPEDGSAVPPDVASAVLTHSEPIQGEVVGIPFSPTDDTRQFLNYLTNSGFQGTQMKHAISIISKMWKLKKSNQAFIWLSFTSNMISCGLREVLVYLAKHNLVNCFVTSGGGVEEDLIKCLGSTYHGSFDLDGAELRNKGWNRIGNLLVPNDNYCNFETWVIPQLDDMLKEKAIWTPSQVTRRLGHAINDESSLLYWCSQNDIPVYCPGITDGSLGDMLYFHSYKNPGLMIDVVADVRSINDLSHSITTHSGIIILGGGLPKHHVCNANLMRNGADSAVYISTAQEFDGSDSGAKPEEAVSWGKIKAEAPRVKVFGDATVAFPIIIMKALLDSQLDTE